MGPICNLHRLRKQISYPINQFTNDSVPGLVWVHSTPLLVRSLIELVVEVHQLSQGVQKVDNISFVTMRSACVFNDEGWLL